MTVMCALRLLTIEQKLADDAVDDDVTRQARRVIGEKLACGCSRIRGTHGRPASGPSTADASHVVVSDQHGSTNAIVTAAAQTWDAWEARIWAKYATRAPRLAFAAEMAAELKWLLQQVSRLPM